MLDSVKFGLFSNISAAKDFEGGVLLHSEILCLLATSSLSGKRVLLSTSRLTFGTGSNFSLGSSVSDIAEDEEACDAKKLSDEG